MQRIGLIGQQLQKNIFALGLMILLSLSSLFIFTSAPSYASTLEELKLIPPQERLTPEEKIERAYELNEGAGIIEERKQEALKAERTGKIDKGEDINLKVYENQPDPTLAEKAQKLVEKIKGKE